MNDFGEILEQWENGGSGTGRRGRGEPATPGETADRGDRAASMADWLDRYPPDRRDEPSSETEPERGRPHMRPERVRIDDTLDLHGFRLDEALAATGAFVERSVAAGYRKILIIHGKGANGQGVLRQQVRAYLEHHPMTGAMGYGRGAEGGRGALWVMLRESRARYSEAENHRSL